MWYLDCFNWKSNPAGRTCPVNTFYSESLEVVVSKANKLLAFENGIDEVRISHETKGCSPQYVSFE